MGPSNEDAGDNGKYGIEKFYDAELAGSSGKLEKGRLPVVQKSSPYQHRLWTRRRIFRKNEALIRSAFMLRPLIILIQYTTITMLSIDS